MKLREKSIWRDSGRVYNHILQIGEIEAGEEEKNARRRMSGWVYKSLSPYRALEKEM